MEFKQLQTSIDLNDPERGFEFTSDDDGVRLFFDDWKNRRVTLRFLMVYWFSHWLAADFHGLPQGELLEIASSNKLASVRASGLASPDEELHHYVISTNEDEWCEVVSRSMEVHRED